MKFALALVALAFAAGAQAAPAKVVAQIVSAGGMPGPDPKICMSAEVNVYSNGKVIETKCGKFARPIASLAPKVAGMIAEAAKIGEPAPLKPINAKDAECQDAPSTLAYLIKPNGDRFAIGGDLNCRQVRAEYNDRMIHLENEVLPALIGLNTLAEITRQY